MPEAPDIDTGPQKAFLCCRHLWQIFESVRQHFVSPSTADVSVNQPDALDMDAAMQKSLGDSLRVALEDAGQIDQHQRQQQQQEQQQHQGRCGSAECPAGEQVSGSTGSKRQRQKTKQHHQQQQQKVDSMSEALQAALAEALPEADWEVTNQPESCQAPQTTTQTASDTGHRTNCASVPSRVADSNARPDALARRICPAFNHPAVDVVSLCHLPDVQADHSCKTNADCGVDSVTCCSRVCSVHAFCQADSK